MIRRARRASAGLCLLALLAVGCGDQVQGEVILAVVAPHRGRNPIQDPFTLVQQVELGLTSSDGDYRALSRSAPLQRFGPGLLGAGLDGTPTLIGLNERQRPVSLGFAEPVVLDAGPRRVLPLAFSRIDWARAEALPAAELALPEPFAARPPTLQLGGAQLEQGSWAGVEDAAALVWAGWNDDRLTLEIRLRDDSAQNALADDLTAGDAVRLYLEDLPLGPLTVGRDGRVDPAGVAEDLSVEPLGTGWRVRLRLPLADAGKNRDLGFDLRLIDRDVDGSSCLLTWVFDPRSQGEDPTPEQVGRLLLGAPLLLAVAGEGSVGSFPTADGPVRLFASWDELELRLGVEVPDDDVRTASSGDNLEGADRLELWLDLANGEPPSIEETRFYRVTVTAGGTAAWASGSSPEVLAPSGTTGRAIATASGTGWALEVVIPWEDLQLAAPQAGWYLGLEARLLDEDGAGARLVSWSDSQSLQPARWGELRLSTVE